MWTSLLIAGGGTLIAAKGIRILLGRYWGTVDPEDEGSVQGKVIIITGANTGIGKATALELAKRGAICVLACRNLSAAEEAILEIRGKTLRGRLVPLHLDLASLKSVRAFVTEFKKNFMHLDILINNAGVYIPVTKKTQTQDGFEMHFGVNHLGHFLLTNLLLDFLTKAAQSRVITLSSMLYMKGQIDFDDLNSDRKILKENVVNNPLYANSKLANVLFSKELAKRLEGTGVTTYCVDPGLVRSDIARHMNIPWYFRLLSPILYLITKTTFQGCQTTVYCAVSKSLERESGEMYQNCGPWPSTFRKVLNDDDGNKLWIVSSKLVGLN